jgi:hypothetical protein
MLMIGWDHYFAVTFESSQNMYEATYKRQTFYCTFSLPGVSGMRGLVESPFFSNFLCVNTLEC